MMKQSKATRTITIFLLIAILAFSSNTYAMNTDDKEGLL